MDRKTRNIITFYGERCRERNVDRQNLPRSKEVRGLIGFEIYVKSEKNNQVWYRNSFAEKLMTGVRQAKILNCGHSKLKKEYKQEK